MRVLMPVSEAAPIVKLGGLGDVAGSLPKALQEIGVNIDVAIPFFPIAKTENLEIEKEMDLNVAFKQQNNPVEVFKTKLPGSDVDVFLFKNDTYFGGGGKDAFANNIGETEMFTFFDLVVLAYIRARLNIYDLIHCNDWHTGLLPSLLRAEFGLDRPATLFTVHNLMYQGVGAADLIEDAGIIPQEHSIVYWDIQDGDVNLMYQGITGSDFINTVSESYAQEIFTPEFGGDFFELLQERQGRVMGILNGIDYTQFPRNYDVSTVAEEKVKMKAALQKELGLEVDPSKPLFGFISRLDANQKGLDILFDSIPAIVKEEGQFILLGTGDPLWEGKFRDLQNSFEPGKVSINIEFDVALARRIYSGSDFLLVPSKYEPCGLIQMMSMWYGTPPVAHAVGGLKDSIKDGETGFLFEDYSSEDLTEAITRAFVLYEDKGKMLGMIKNAMQQDFSWEVSAQKYKELYEKIMQLRLESKGLGANKEEISGIA